ncbi:DNA/RNA non-specific endonuclease [Butyrivibrio sp. NC2007]|uniref:DNA/RNA non-specific endonuclease n=1 Tax=Butyrivibrio sp. NC2007 TaxID=1280683 RepID=UPI0003B4CF49|nr:DNA/RNA non-specific endonuclease [Butyrivibrio sp. NC2007]
MKPRLRMVGSANRIYALLLALSITMSSFLFWSVQTHAEDEISTYDGNASVELSKNVPGFTMDEITTKSFESYGDRDKLGRVTTAYACIGQDLMPKEERQSIGDVRPTGWKQNKYPGLVDSDPPYLYNRCHMIGFQLTGENANEKNLVTGTRYMNVDGMLPYENEVASYIHKTGNHVMYRVTPVFTGKNLLCDGVQIEAYSVEDKGKGVSFNVFCYNVQPGVTIDYKDGSNKADPNHKKVVSADEFVITGGNTGTSVDRSAPLQTDREATYILNKNSKKFHLPTCDSVTDMKEKNKEYSTKTREEMIADGYDPCKRCNP